MVEAIILLAFLGLCALCIIALGFWVTWELAVMHERRRARPHAAEDKSHDA